MMRTVFTTLIFALAILVGGELGATPAFAEQVVTIGTAGVTGVYYPAGGAICRLVNRSRKEHGLRCAVESTNGSINNLEFLRKHELDLGIVQSDMLYHAYKGDDIFTDVGADKDLRIITFLHSEPFTVIARKSSGIKTFDDLKGKRVYTGAEGSGTRVTMDELMRQKGWSEKSFTHVENLASPGQANALCSGKVDALVFAGGHPNGAVQQVTSACPTRLIDVSGPAVDAMIKVDPYYSRAVIPGGMYVGTLGDVQTFGVDAVLVASADLDSDEVYLITKAIFDNLDNFKALHPVLATLDINEMVRATNISPYHEGALRYYKEKGMMQEHNTSN
jgi:TRAP transporter TAXI family solute receptor